MKEEFLQFMRLKKKKKKKEKKREIDNFRIEILQ